MDNDSAHHANIALHMYLTGDYVSLVDYGKDYLDKPHLHFWLTAASFNVFGVNGFAYKFPSLLFTILGIYSTYQIGKRLYNSETGKLAALILASSFAFILSNNDVRMDAILTACIALSIWQLVAFIQEKKMNHLIGAAIGLALGFSTKGHIAVFVPAVAALFYILYRKEWNLFFNWKWVVLFLVFGLFIFPVVYCYYLQFNLHPEKIVRGKDHINGVKFILLNQSVDRFSGEMGADGKNDYFFFLHSFLWAFAPWSLLAYAAVAGRCKNFIRRKEEWLTTGVFLVLLVIVSLSGFKLPHYLNIAFPTTAVMVAATIKQHKEQPDWVHNVYKLQITLAVLLLLLTAVINFWAFPVQQHMVMAVLVLLLTVFFYFLKTYRLNRLQKAVATSVAAMGICFFLLNANFYPQLLTFQGGNELAVSTKGKVDPEAVYFWEDNYSSSYNFSTATMRKPFTAAVLQPDKKIWLLYDIRNEAAIKEAGYQIGEKFTTADYEITKLDIKFLNPAKRAGQCTQMVIAAISK